MGCRILWFATHPFLKIFLVLVKYWVFKRVCYGLGFIKVIFKIFIFIKLHPHLTVFHQSLVMKHLSFKVMPKFDILINLNVDVHYFVKNTNWSKSIYDRQIIEGLMLHTFRYRALKALNYLKYWFYKWLKNILF